LFEKRADYHPITAKRYLPGYANLGYYYKKYDILRDEYREFDGLSFGQAWRLANSSMDYDYHLRYRRRSRVLRKLHYEAMQEQGQRHRRRTN
jgi:hypothetical protein